jgi:hypothetical protein
MVLQPYVGWIHTCPADFNHHKGNVTPPCLTTVDIVKKTRQADVKFSLLEQARMASRAKQVESQKSKSGSLQKLHEAVDLNQRLHAHGHPAIASNELARVGISLRNCFCYISLYLSLPPSLSLSLSLSISFLSVCLSLSPRLSLSPSLSPHNFSTTHTHTPRLRRALCPCLKVCMRMCICMSACDRNAFVCVHASMWV